MLVKKALIIAAVAYLSLSVILLAAEDSVTVEVSFSIVPFATISLSGGPESGSVQVATSIPTPTSVDVARGYLELPSAVSLTVASNTHWTVFVQALSRTLGTSYDGVFTWDIAALRVGTKGGFVPVSMDPQAVVQGIQGEHPVSVDYRISLPETGLPEGNYEATLLYTITSL